MSDEFNVGPVQESVNEINELISAFQADAKKLTNKAAARRARTTSNQLAKALKNFRAVSIKS